MKILLVMDPGIKMPVTGYGGIERIIEMLAKEYVRMGHEVHLLVTGGSHVEGCVMHDIGKEGFPPSKDESRKALFSAWRFIWKHRNRFDLIHNFGRLIYLFPVLNHPVKKTMSYQREITRRNIIIFNRIPNKNIVYTGCSADLIKRAQVPGKWHAVYNGCEFSKYDLTDHLPTDAPLMFLGRIERVKGCHTAIRVAKETSQQLIIAGNISPLEDEKKYYENEIAPWIDGAQIKYVGQVNDKEKNEWLGKAKALIFPIEWNEPFGIVMVEAMACGTPVLGYNRGSVEEIITDCVTGAKVSDLDEMIQAVKTISNIDRTNCREVAKNRFDISIIASEYLKLHMS